MKKQELTLNDVLDTEKPVIINTMYNNRVLNNRNAGTTIEVYDAAEGETIEQKIERLQETNDGIEDGAPLIYTEKAEGVIAAYDIRSDKWDIAMEARAMFNKENVTKKATENAEQRKREAAEGNERIEQEK